MLTYGELNKQTAEQMVKATDTASLAKYRGLQKRLVNFFKSTGIEHNEAWKMTDEVLKEIPFPQRLEYLRGV